MFFDPTKSQSSLSFDFLVCCISLARSGIELALKRFSRGLFSRDLTMGSTFRLDAGGRAAMARSFIFAEAVRHQRLDGVEGLFRLGTGRRNGDRHADPGAKR